MDSEHPSYPNPTIIEAICDIHFRLPETKGWKPSSFGKFFRRVQDDFPEMEPVSEMGIQVDLGPSSLSSRLLPQSQKMRFKHKSRSLIIQLSESSFSVNTLQPYNGWKVMWDDIVSTWAQVEEVLEPEAIDRIGLRYINRINKVAENDRPGDWLKANEYISEGVLRSDSGFLLRVQAHLNRESVLIITLGDTNSTLDGGYGAIILDIDRFVEKQMAVEQQSFKQELDKLHSEVWNIFSSATSRRLEEFLNRR